MSEEMQHTPGPYSLKPTDGSLPGEFLAKDGFVVAHIMPGKSNDRGGEAKRICSTLNAAATKREGWQPIESAPNVSIAAAHPQAKTIA